MRIREPRRPELRRERVSRKLFAKTLKVFAWVGIVAGVLVLATGMVLITELQWLTSGERRSATEALSSIDSLQDFSTMSDVDFDAGLMQAKVKIQVAEASTRTIRDSVVANSLFDYWLNTKADFHEKREIEATRHALPQSTWGPNSFLWRDPNQAGADRRLEERRQLHKFLD